MKHAVACHICGLPGTPNDPLVADHIIPRSLGGTSDIANLLPAHRSCNATKGGVPPDSKARNDAAIPRASRREKKIAPRMIADER
jgi:5-methylcytosine-specific restriction endonuclease McrA